MIQGQFLKQKNHLRSFGAHIAVHSLTRPDNNDCCNNIPKTSCDFHISLLEKSIAPHVHATHPAHTAHIHLGRIGSK